MQPARKGVSLVVVVVLNIITFVVLGQDFASHPSVTLPEELDKRGLRAVPLDQEAGRITQVFATTTFTTLADCVESEPNESDTQANLLTVPGTCTGNITPTDPFVYQINYSGGLVDHVEDVYKINHTGGGLKIDLTWTNTPADLDVLLVTINGTTISPVTGCQTSNGQCISNDEGPGPTPETFTHPSLGAGTYYVFVSSFEGSPSTPYTLAASVPGGGGIPNPPSNLAAVPASMTQINLSWSDNSSDETSFRIEVKIGAGGVFSDIGQSILANTTSVGVQGLTPGTTYTFRIRARGAGGDSAYSNEATATTQSSGGGSCVASSTTFCAQGNRYRVTGTFLLQGGQGSGPLKFTSLTDASGYFTYNDPSDVQGVIKILNVCGSFQRFWVFIGALTNQEVHITVTDLQTGITKNYDNPLQVSFLPVYDTNSPFMCTTSACNYGISPTSNSFTSAGGTGTVNVSTTAGCNWTAVSNSPSFITVTSGASGSGNGTVGYSVAANSGSSQRTGTVTIAGQTFTVTQAGTGGGGSGFNGTWSGTTSQAGKTVTMEIANNAFTKFGFTYHAVGSCTVDGGITITFTTPLPISGNTFTISSQGSGNPKLAYNVQGTFDSNTTAHGNISFTLTQTSPLPSCNASGSATFNATKN